ncbi:MAG: helix-turn-helix transcriptional regulator [Chloroflexota bacterium]|nr:helix-turn-helix transcriptional regulator [Chloroflexota bacterium]
MPVRIRIGELAKQQGFTIKAVAERAGVAYNTAHALCTGRATRIDLDTLDRICTALKVEPRDIFVRFPVQEHGGPEYTRRGGYGTDHDWATGAGDRRGVDGV